MCSPKTAHSAISLCPSFYCTHGEGAGSDLMGSGPNWSASKKSIPIPPKVREWGKSISACIWNDMLLRQVPTELIQKIKLKEAIQLKKSRESIRERSALDSKKNIQRTIKEEQKKQSESKTTELRFSKTLRATSGERMMLRKR